MYEFYPDPEDRPFSSALYHLLLQVALARTIFQSHQQFQSTHQCQPKM